jgi:hypothetical protein
MDLVTYHKTCNKLPNNELGINTAFVEGFAEYFANQTFKQNNRYYKYKNGVEMESYCPDAVVLEKEGHYYEHKVADFFWDIFDNNNDIVYDESIDNFYLEYKRIYDWEGHFYNDIRCFIEDSYQNHMPFYGKESIIEPIRALHKLNELCGKY